MLESCLQWTYPFKLEAVGDCSSDASSLLEHLISWVDAVTVADEIPRELHPALNVVVDPSGDVVWDFLGFKSNKIVLCSSTLFQNKN